MDNFSIIAANVAAQCLFWRRVWVVQEILLAKTLTVQLGPRMRPPETVLQVSRIMTGPSEEVSEETTIIRQLPLMLSAHDDTLF